FDGGVHTIKELVAKVREERKRQTPAVQK
ncbi:thiol:disulfide interchange protein DsbA/DsbL, partial [Neisseria gonorrhoeae]